MQYLMIDTKDNRRFFTHEKNYPQLIEFAKTFNAEIFLVSSSEDLPVMELFEIVPAFCDANYKYPRHKVNIIETKIVHDRPNRVKIRSTSNQIQEYVMKKFANGEVVCLKELKDNFAKSKLSTACFCNHVRRAVQLLNLKGIETQKVGAGKYKVK